jgi:hypothetical protein
METCILNSVAERSPGQWRLQALRPRFATGLPLSVKASIVERRWFNEHFEKSWAEPLALTLALRSRRYQTEGQPVLNYCQLRSEQITVKALKWQTVRSRLKGDG